MMDIENPNEPARIESQKQEEEDLYNKLQQLNKYMDFLDIQEDYIKDDQIKLKRYTCIFTQGRT